MHSDKQTTIEPVITGYAGTYEGSSAATRAQVMYATGGPMKLITPTHVWMVMPSQAIWMPAGEPHEVVASDRVQIQHLYFDGMPLPDACFAFDANPFFQELVQRVARFNHHESLIDCECRIVQVLLDEIGAQEPSTLNLPLGKEKKVQKVTTHLINTLQVNMNTEEAAALAGVSERNFSRLFVNETGMGYRDWCLKLTLLEAISRLQAGESINQVAFELGYENSSAFTYMFHKSLGKPPCLFLERPNGL
jgi:AraC-type DNA-binding domain-containing proteins